MREIKFRLIKDNKIVGYEQVGDMKIGCKWNYSKDNFAWRGMFIASDRRDKYIGLKDKNGKEIFEGDICENGDWEPDAHAYSYRIEEVRYIEDEGQFVGWNFNVGGMTCKVIGNIYENPELLNSGEQDGR